jgi:hypothetical protein
MLFIIEKTSLLRDEKPHDRAVRKSCVYTDIIYGLIKDNPFYKQHPQRWYGEGINHREEDGNSIRDYVREKWFIEINSLEELLAISSEVDYGLTITPAGDSGYKYPTIEICDDFID